MSNLLPATDGLFLGQDSPSKRWDGNRLRNLVRPTVFGAAIISPATPEEFLYLSENQSGFTGIVKVPVPAGKTFKLWAMGQMYCDFANYVRIICHNDTTGQILQATAVGNLYEEYYPAGAAAGPVDILLKAGNYDPAKYNAVSGFMVFSIE
jgi:hypothetical protein